MRDLADTFLTLDSPDGSGFEDLLGHSITYRIALGPHQGRKAFTLQAVPAVAGGDDNSSVAKAAGFSLHAGVASEAHERDKLERLCRYITRPAVSTERLSLTAQGNVRYRLKTPYRDGTTDVVLLRASCPSPFALRPSPFGPALGFYRPAGSSGADATRQPRIKSGAGSDALSRRLCAESSATRTSDAGQARPARCRTRDPSLQTVRPRAAANDITGPEGTRLTVLHPFSCMDATLG